MTWRRHRTRASPASSRPQTAPSTGAAPAVLQAGMQWGARCAHAPLLHRLVGCMERAHCGPAPCAPKALHLAVTLSPAASPPAPLAPGQDPAHRAHSPRRAARLARAAHGPAAAGRPQPALPAPPALHLHPRPGGAQLTHQVSAAGAGCTSDCLLLPSISSIDSTTAAAAPGAVSAEEAMPMRS